MKILFTFALIFAFVYTSNYRICAQIVTARSDNNQSSSLAEILEQLNKTGFPEARIGLFFGGANNDDITLSAPAESAFYSPGFKIYRLEKECELVLRNEQAVILSGGKSYSYAFSDVYKEQNKLINDAVKNRIVHPVEVGINLKRMRYKEGKKPHLLAGSLEDAKKFGIWRTELKEKGGLSAIDSVIIFSNDVKPYSRIYTGGEEISFTFDSQETAVKFDTAFRQAIKLCRAK